MYTTYTIVLLLDNATVRPGVTVPALIISLMVLCVPKSDYVLQILNYLTEGHHLHVNSTNILATCPTVTINKPRNVNVPIMIISQKSDYFGRMVEQFTCWQTDVDTYRRTLENYCDANNLKMTYHESLIATGRLDSHLCNSRLSRLRTKRYVCQNSRLMLWWPSI